MSIFTHLLEQYGYAVLFLALLLELIALPLPGEFIMTYAGLIVYQGGMNWPLSILVAGLGACAGMTVSYGIGYKLGTPFFEKYGAKVHFGPDKLRNVSAWYERYGNKLLLVAYFIPGVRHITGLFSGTTRLSFRRYAAFAYTGAFLWVGLFISLGRLLGPEWEKYHAAVNRYMLLTGLATAFVYLCVYVYRNKRDNLRAWLTRLLNLGYAHYRSMTKVKWIVAAAFVLFVSFASLLIGVIQDFLAHEFTSFDDVATFLMHQIFGPAWSQAMNRAVSLGALPLRVAVLALTVLWVGFKGKDRKLEIAVTSVAFLGGEALNMLLRWGFHRIGPAGDLSGPSFPSHETMLSLACYGFASYLLLRHNGNLIVRIAALFATAAVSLLVGIGLVYLDLQYPSDVFAGYVFGGVWLSLNVLLLEVFRLLGRTGDE